MLIIMLIIITASVSGVALTQYTAQHHYNLWLVRVLWLVSCSVAGFVCPWVRVQDANHSEGNFIVPLGQQP